METYKSDGGEQLSSVEGYRLSPQQRHLWSLQPDGSAYVAQIVISLEGKLDAHLLREALRHVMRKHEILSTNFHSTPGLSFPLQVIGSPDRLSWETVDAKSWDLVDAVEKVCREQRRHPFDFERGGVVRALLLETAADSHFLFVTIPTLCADAWTLNNLFEEISLRCQARSADGEVAEGPVQYVEFSEWQNELLEADEADAARQYWRKQRAAARNAPALPFGRRPHGGGDTTPEVDSVSTMVGHEVIAKLDRIAQTYGAQDSSIVLLACWQSLLWRLTGQPEIVVGHIFKGRKFEPLHDAYGLFAKRVPLSCRFEKGFRFRDILEQTGQSLQEAADREESFIREQSETAFNSASELSIGFDFNVLPAGRPNDDVTLSIVGTFVRLDRCQLELVCVRKKDSLLTEFRYDSSLFLPQEIEYLATQFEVLLASAAQDPETPVAELDILDAAERRRLLFELNDTDSAYPADECLHQLFEQQVERTPRSIALVDGDRQLTYAELNARANQLAHHLRAQGVGPETLVGICLERSQEMVLALLAVLKAGGAYVPLDPSYPETRLAFIIEETSAHLLLSVDKLRARLPGHAERLVCLDSEWPVIDKQSEANPVNPATPDNLAYVLYTSGSTGNPKGVMIPHRGLVNYLSWAVKFYRVGEGFGAPVHSPIGFDLTITSLFCPLLAGQSVMLIPEKKGIEGLSSALAAATVDFSLVKITPSHLEVLNQLLSNTEAATRSRVLVIGGEALPGETLSFWRARAPQTRLINEYGPTETVVGCCVHEVEAVESAAGAVPIGRPISNMRLYLLDARMWPVGVGMEGELYIGGTGLARGYLERPDLTAESFVPSPYSDLPGERLYKSGDIARYRFDGQLEFVGRHDAQVKIRGFRIELGEVEVALGQHTSVREAVAVAREDVPGEKRLVAYVVAERGEVFSVSELQNFLKQKLPDYMVPTAFVQLETLPLTPNGKVDRRALPHPEVIRPELNDLYAPPRNELERSITATWQEMLRLEKVGIHDNFFDLGGHSLLMVQTHGKLQQALGREIAVLHMFQYPTISTLAEHLSQAGDGNGTVSFERSQSRAETRRESVRRQRQSRRQQPEDADPAAA